MKEIARQLYRTRQQVAGLEKLLASALPQEEAELGRRLQEAREEMRQLQSIIDGRKTSGC